MKISIPQIKSDQVNRPSLWGTCGGLSLPLQLFVWKSPHHRLGIIQMVRQFAIALPPGSRVLDIGAGAAPYRELFSHCCYQTSDLLPGNNTVDYICPIDNFPLPNQSLDAILCTEVLEHVPDPLAALKEMRRLLVPGGYLCLTVPFLLGIHEKRDYYRFTKDCLENILDQTGYRILVLTPRLGLPMTLWSHLWLFSLWVARPDKPVSFARRGFHLLVGTAFLLVSALSFFPLWLIDRLDRKQDCTIGYALLAQRPEERASNE